MNIHRSSCCTFPAGTGTRCRRTRSVTRTRPLRSTVETTWSVCRNWNSASWLRTVSHLASSPCSQTSSARARTRHVRSVYTLQFNSNRGVATAGISVYIPLPPNQSILQIFMWLLVVVFSLTQDKLLLILKLEWLVKIYTPQWNSWLRPWTAIIIHTFVHALCYSLLYVHRNYLLYAIMYTFSRLFMKTGVKYSSLVHSAWSVLLTTSGAAAWWVSLSIQTRGG